VNKKKSEEKRKRREKRRKDTDERVYLSSHSRAVGQLIKAIVNLGISFSCEGQALFSFFFLL
jgi:hypothetical protein